MFKRAFVSDVRCLSETIDKTDKAQSKALHVDYIVDYVSASEPTTLTCVLTE